MIMTNSSESDQDALDEAACGTTQESPFFLEEQHILRLNYGG